MTVPETSCTRCGHSVEPEGTLVAIERGSLRQRFAMLRLCSRCTDSLSVWLLRHDATRAERAEPLAGQTSSATRHRARHRRSGARRQPRRAFARKYLAYGGLLCAYAIVVGAALILLVRELNGK